LSSPSNNPPQAGMEPRQPVTENLVIPKARTVSRCNFRLAGRLSNEDSRAITAVHETLATHIAASLDAYLGTTFDVRFDAINQQSVKDHIAEVPSLTYIVLCSSPLVMVEFDLSLVFPMIELLMGGEGEATGAERGLSEIEEEMMLDIVSLVMHEAEAVWSIPGLAIEPGSRIRPSMMLQLLRPTEKLTALRFEGKISNASGWFSLVLSTSLLDLVVKQLKEDQVQKKSRMFNFPSPPLRERILDCEMEVAAELPELKVSVKDLVSLEPGLVLKLRAPIRTPAMLTIGGRGLFEAVPVRSGAQRAAQLGRRSQLTDWKRR